MELEFLDKKFHQVLISDSNFGNLMMLVPLKFMLKLVFYVVVLFKYLGIAS